MILFYITIDKMIKLRNSDLRRKRLSESNIFPVFDLEFEYKKLHTLFFDTTAYGKIFDYGRKSNAVFSYDLCLQAMFLDWDLRGTFISVEEMLLGLEIGEDNFAESVTESRLLDYIQFIINGALFVKVNHRKYNLYESAGETIFKALYENSNMIVQELGAKMVEENGEVFIVYKDEISDVIAQADEDIKASSVEYLKIDNRGDCVRKAEILCSLAKKLEPYEEKLNSTEFKSLCKDTTMLLNRSGIRHAKDPHHNIEAKFANMNAKDLEIWYDRTFHMVMACLAVVPYIDFKGDLKKLKEESE